MCVGCRNYGEGIVGKIIASGDMFQHKSKIIHNFAKSRKYMLGCKNPQKMVEYINSIINQ